MSRARCLAAALLVIGLGFQACADDKKDVPGSGGIPTNCGLPSPSPGLNRSRVPEPLYLEGEVELSGTQKARGGWVSTINIPYSVQEALPLYQAAVEEAGFEIVSQDNEGFEAEFYLRSRKHHAAVQIRRSTCEKASIVFVNIVSVKSLSRPQELVTPQPSPTDQPAS